MEYKTQPATLLGYTLIHSADFSFCQVVEDSMVAKTLKKLEAKN